MQKKIYFFLTLLGIVGCFVFYLISENLCTERRYSFDFGSGATKGKGALVNKCKGEILTSLGEHAEHNKIITCLTKKENEIIIPSHCIEKTIKSVKNIEKYFGIDCTTAKCAGVATAWARKASNGDSVIQIINQMNIKTHVITQDIEGNIGFYNALADSETKHVRKENIIVWDIGGGSFQLSTLDEKENVHVYKGGWGIETFEQHLRNTLNIYQIDELPYFAGEDLDTAIEMATETLGKPILNDPVISKKLNNPKTVVFAIGRPMRHGLHKEMDSSLEPTKEEILKIAKEFQDYSSDEITDNTFQNLPAYFAPSAQATAIILYGIMNGAGINKISIIDSPINDYVLVEPKFWD